MIYMEQRERPPACNDSSTYRKLLFKNVNLNLIAISKFKPDNVSRKYIEIQNTDTQNLSIDFKRLISNPHISLFEINSLFAWINNPDVQLNFKLRLNKEFSFFQRMILKQMKPGRNYL